MKFLLFLLALLALVVLAGRALAGAAANAGAELRRATDRSLPR